MAVTNAISSVIIVGALLAVAAHPVDGGAMTPTSGSPRGSGAVAAAFASVNIFGGFLVVRQDVWPCTSKTASAPAKDAAPKKDAAA